MKNKAIFKWNGGALALLCSKCIVIIKTGKDFTSDEHLACRGKRYLPPQFCGECADKKIKNMDEIKSFIERLGKIGISVAIAGNYPWVYLDQINGMRVMEKFQSEYGFTIAWMPIRNGQKLKFTNIGKIFDLIRKYTKNA